MTLTYTDDERKSTEIVENVAFIMVKRAPAEMKEVFNFYRPKRKRPCATQTVNRVPHCICAQCQQSAGRGAHAHRRAAAEAVGAGRAPVRDRIVSLQTGQCARLLLPHSLSIGCCCWQTELEACLVRMQYHAFPFALYMVQNPRNMPP